LGAAGWIYQSLGVPGYPDLPLSDRLANADAAYNARPTQMQAETDQPAFVQPEGLGPMIPKLRAALATRPDDLQGHVLLAQNEAALGDFAATRRAQEVVVRLKGADAGPDDLAFLAYAMVRAAGGLVTPEAEKVLIDLLKMDPRNGWGRFYSGLMFAEIGRPDRTFALWEPLLAESGPDAPWYLPIRSQIADIAPAAGVNYTLPEEQAAPDVATGPDAAPGPDAAAIAGASAMSETDRNAMIANMVDGLETRLNTEGGSVEEWSRLITSLSVLQNTDRAQTAYVAAQAAFAGKPGELSALHAAATQAGIAP
ncbi:MAG: c-type cytochrome biogenesis protein CcmI, partial [Candidatus Saccharibacteria bacterium]|nr:c-type cytochrome biogenesis protein CcmI [Pseudorhodobacter sp.]